MRKKRENRTIAVIQARMGSTRLPGKSMLPLAGKPMLWHVIERTKKIARVDSIVLATTTKKRDDVLARLAKKSGVGVFRGAEEDVLKRFIGAAKKMKGDIIVRINADCPLFDPGSVDELVRIRAKVKADGAFYIVEGTAIGGFEVVTRELLERINTATRKPYDAFAHEHVTAYLNPRYYPGNKSFAKTIFIKPKSIFKTNKLTIAVDREADYLSMKLLYERFYCKNKIIPLPAVVRFLKQQRKSV